METNSLILQYLIPHHPVSRLAGIIAGCRIPWVKNWLIKTFIKHYQVDMTEVLEPDQNSYPTFNDFFTRAVKTRIIPIITDNTATATENAISHAISPVDGSISQRGKIARDNLIQAKGKQYTLEQLLVTPELISYFYDGDFITLYLSPRDYHRVHLPLTGRLRQMIYVPGKLFSVNDVAVKNIAQLFGRNERVITIFDTAIGPVALIMVGAMIVGSIKTVWDDVITPNSYENKKGFKVWRYDDRNIVLKIGDEVGRFQLGSTVIVLFPKNTINWSNTLELNDHVKMGQSIGTTITE